MDKQALRAEIVRNGMTCAEVAKEIGISESTFWRRMNKGNFGLDEVNAMIILLGIKSPECIFFASAIT